MEHGIEYGLEQIYNVIDSRSPLIVTTGLSDLRHPRTLPTPIYDQMCASIRFFGEIFRKVTALDKLACSKKLIEPPILSPVGDNK